MSEPKPVVIGYIRDEPMMSRQEMHAIQGKLIRHAQSRGLVMGALFVEKDAMSQTAFNSAFARLDTWGPRYLLVPGIDHLDHAGGRAASVVVEDLTARGAEVIVVA